MREGGERAGEERECVCVCEGWKEIEQGRETGERESGRDRGRWSEGESERERESGGEREHTMNLI